MKITAETTIDRPRSEVFAAFCDLDRAPERMSGIDSVEVLTDGPFAVGTRWRETRTMFGKQATEEMYVTALEAPASYRVEADGHGAHYVSDITFDELTPTSTRVAMTFAGTGTSLVAKLMTPISWLFAGATRKAVQRDLEDMKAVLEGSTAQS